MKRFRNNRSLAFWNCRNSAPKGISAGDVTENLCFEGGGVGEVLLRAEEAAKLELDVLGWCAGERGQQKRFDGEFDALERGPGACVGDGGPGDRWRVRESA